VPLIVHIAPDKAGTLRGTLDCPAQRVVGLALAQITADAGRLAFTVPGVGGRYQAQWDAARMSWKGEWSQGGQQGELRFSAVPPSGPVAADWQLPSDAEIAKLIAERNAPLAGQGIVVGVLGPQGQRVVADGTGAGAKVDRNTLFEIGSMSEAFTGLILADMVNKGEVSLDDPAAKYLPKGHHMPERGGRQITLRDLSTHRSGLPPLGPFEPWRRAAQLSAFARRPHRLRNAASQSDHRSARHEGYGSHRAARRGSAVGSTVRCLYAASQPLEPGDICRGGRRPVECRRPADFRQGGARSKVANRRGREDGAFRAPTGRGART
jgi:hypothetical protein